VNEQNRPTGRIARLDHVESRAAAAGDLLISISGKPAMSAWSCAVSVTPSRLLQEHADRSEDGRIPFNA
jgi:hypothetical protein